MQTEPTENQLTQLKDIVIIYAPVCLYKFLIQLEVINVGKKIGVYYAPEEVAGIPLNEWPKDVVDDYHNLCESLPLDVLQKVFAEIHYFLIFTIASIASQHITLEKQTNMLDMLFSVFSDKEVWGEEYPSVDAFTKYRKSENPMLVFSHNLGAFVGVNDAIEVVNLTTSVGDILKAFVSPSVENLFH